MSISVGTNHQQGQGTSESVVVVAGMGEVGRPLFRILSRSFECVPVDIHPVQLNCTCSILHICYPFQIPNFIDTTLGYLDKYKPALTIINSTVTPGTTRHLQQLAREAAIAYSPVRGKHAVMESDMLRYKKFVAACDPTTVRNAVAHFEGAGFETSTFRTPEIAELSKLLETTYLGVLIAWAQEMEHFASLYDATFDEVNRFVKEVEFLPAHIFPGHIGGHCVMPNIDILRGMFESRFLEAVVDSNYRKGMQSLAPVGGGQ